MIALLGSAAPGSRVQVIGDVRASVVPAAPDSAQVNMVTYLHPGGVGPKLNALRAAYEGSGVRRWAVWVPDTDKETARMLTSSDYLRTATLPAMMLRLASLGRRPPRALDVDDRGHVETIGWINEAALGHEPGTIAGAFRDEPDARTGRRTYYRAWHDGSAAGALCTIRHRWSNNGDDCGLSWLGVAPVARRKGVATALLTTALHDARERGCITATLQASEQGEPLYRALGFTTVGEFGVYETTA
ncbi:GNAT family N-acetyltransferase [Conexibacter stalactiti]|uniref:GNAT family N-acetyltransferase n=1 Tax=Conexibacter stalactiti TaxID=1940611 RepID=A0ABU4HW84_9ACTN|nr:GNAT family N-acetyltransferase [Conexibacter stalactiti]MDW5597429.1 GNAT family N-acetyltransferase [Conexibacter stalactiti]MEC5038071.1 GNAT family N-acetyltransferase [Conexibacter stalactiti]